MKNFGYIVVLLLAPFSMSGQVSVNSSGGEAIGSNGSVSFSVGQVDYINFSSAQNMMSEGVQQPIELYTVKIEELQEKVYLTLYPNPTTQNLWLQFDGAVHNRKKIEVYSISGQKVKSLEIDESKPQLDVSDLANGTYIIRVYAHGTVLFTKRFVKS